MRHAYFVKRHIPNNLSCISSNNPSVLIFCFNNLAIIDTIFVKFFEDCILILLIAICAKSYFVLVSWLLSSFSYQFIQVITCWLYPFTDGKCRKKASVFFYV